MRGGGGGETADRGERTRARKNPRIAGDPAEARGSLDDARGEEREVRSQVRYDLDPLVLSRKSRTRSWPCLTAAYWRCSTSLTALPAVFFSTSS